MNKFIPFVAALAVAITSCSDSKTPADNAALNASPSAKVAGNVAAVNAETAGNAAVPAVEGTKTITLANGASVTWIQDNEGKKLMPRELFSDASDSLYESLSMLAGIPASVSTFLVKTDGKYILFDAGLGAWGGQLLKRLAALNVEPDSIGLVYLTHFHADHIAGLVKNDNAGKM